MHTQPIFRRAHYQYLAEIIDRLAVDHKYTKAEIAAHFRNYLHYTNDNFDPARFMSAALGADEKKAS